MQYMILIYASEASWGDYTPEEGKAIYQKYMEYSRELAESGLMVCGSELQPSHTAKTIRVQGGKPVTTDGPFAETREQLGGYYLIEAPDPETALVWAAKCPGMLHGSIEVRACAENASTQNA